MTTDVVDQLALRALADRYALGIDHRDAQLFCGVFHRDARLRVYSQAESERPDVDVTGHDALGTFTVLVASFTRTLHFVGTSAYEVDGDTATGEVYCIAHHLQMGDGGSPTDYVMHVRYQDQYRRDEGDWTIIDRRALVDWTELREISLGPW